MRGFHAVWLMLSAGLVWAAIVTLPRWLFTSINRGRLWELRDRIYDETRAGTFEGHEEQARFVIGFVERLIIVTPSLTPRNVRLVSRTLRALPAEERRRRVERIEALLTAAPSRLIEHRERALELLNYQIFMGSWNGLRVAVQVIGAAGVRRCIHGGPAPTPAAEHPPVSYKVRRLMSQGPATTNDVAFPDAYVELAISDDHDVLCAV